MPTATLAWYLHRLRAMSPVEAIGHVRRRLATASDRRGFPAQPFDPTTRTIPAPPLTHEQVRIAALARSGIWRVLHGTDLRVDDPPAWHRDYLAGVDLSTNACAFDLEHRSLPDGADIKLICDLNRWYHIALVARSVAEKRTPVEDAAWCERVLRNWLAVNTPYNGWNWTSALESAMRLIHYASIEPALRDAGIETRELTSAILPAHVHFTWRYRSFGSSANNHWIGELAGLIVAQAAWPDAARFSPPLKELVRLLVREIAAQFAGDGVNREHALHYHHYSLDLCRTALKALEVAGLSPGAATLERLAQAEEVAAILDPPSPGWDYGDSDDADLLPLHVRSRSRGQKGWQVLDESGYAAYRDDRWCLRCDASSLGYLATAAHGHCDALHVSLWHEGKPLVIDPGTGAYYADRMVRDPLASWSAHNGPVPDGVVRPVRRGTFLWTDHHPRPTIAQRGTDEVEMTIDHGTGVARRRVERRVDGRGWTVRDAVQGGRGEFHVRWTFAPGTFLAELGPGVFRVANETGLHTMHTGPNWIHAAVTDVPCSPSLRVIESTCCLELVGRCGGDEFETVMEMS